MGKSAMRPVYFYRILLFLALYGGCYTLTAQVVSADAGGRKIIVFSDGSWRYFGERDSSVEWADSLHPDSPEFAEPVAQASEAAGVVNQIALELVQSRVALARLEGELDSLANEPPASREPSLSEKRNELTELKEEVGKLDEQYALAKEWAALLAGTAYFPPLVRRNKLVEWQRSHGFAGEVELTPIAQNPIPKPAHTGPFRFHRPPRAEDDLALYPPMEPCELAYAGTDATTGLNRRDTRSSLFFSKTDKALQAAFPKSEFIRCSGYLTAISGGLRFLHLDISIASPKAPQLFGSFEKGGLLELLLLSGKSVRLFNNRPDTGVWEPASQSTVYHLQFQVGGDAEKILTKGELDAATLHWSLVKEEFEIYELDFFRQHFSCLERSR